MSSKNEKRTAARALRAAQEHLKATEAAALTKLAQVVENTLSLYDQFVDPSEALLGPDGQMWNPIGSNTQASLGVAGLEAIAYRTETELAILRNQCRWMWLTNEFAICGHENRISYIIGTGHQVIVSRKKDATIAEDRLTVARNIINTFREVNNWDARQQETLMRYDRDGEAFLRFFKCEDGVLRVRFVEPECVSAPPSAEAKDSFGIATEPDDVEEVLGYHIDGEYVAVDEVQHRKGNTDAAYKRGLPLFYPVRKNLARASRILRNMGIVVEIQTSIAMIRKHANANKSAIRGMNEANANIQMVSTAPAFGNANSATRNFRQYPPGSIVDAYSGLEYEFPANTLDPGKPVTALQAELRAIASRIVMPEFMLTADASNANYSSTLVAEGPAVKKFEREQSRIVEYDGAVYNRVLAFAVQLGYLTAEEVAQVDVKCTPPNVISRDQFKEAQSRQIDILCGILSKQTATAESGRDYEEEQNNIVQHEERFPNDMTLPRGNLDQFRLPGDAGNDNANPAT